MARELLLKADGKMAEKEWIYDPDYQGWYYLQSDGSYAYSTWQGDYYLNPNGKMAIAEWVYDKNYKAWYYLKGNGAYARSEWQKNYYLKADGKWLFQNGYKILLKMLGII